MFCFVLLTCSSHIQLTSTTVLPSHLELMTLHVSHRLCLFFFIYLIKGKLEKTKVILIFNAQLPETTKQYVLYRCFVLFYKPERNWLLSERSTSSFQFKRRTCYTLAVFSTTEGWSCLGESVSHPPSGAGWLLSEVGHKLLTHQQFAGIRFGLQYVSQTQGTKEWTLPESYVSPCPLP